MIRGFYTAASSMVSQQTNLDTIANNMANISTTGFKPQQVGFSALLYENMNGGAANQIAVGHGVKVEKMGIDFKQGDFNQTGMKMDCAISGQGFFAIQDRANETITYTRDGSFHVGVEDSDSYLVNAAGNYVLDSDGEKIDLEKGFDPSVIGVSTFPNPYGLELKGGNQFAPTEASGEAEAVEKPVIKTENLENSAVDIAKEMVKMIEASKGFSFGSKVVQTADEMEKVINQLR